MHTVSSFSNHAFKKYLASQTTYYSYYETPIGKLILFATVDGIYKASFALHDQELGKYIYAPTLPNNNVILVGTPFQCKVWQAALSIPLGSTCSYQELAQIIGHSQSWRAVATALAQNKIPYFIPCHRIQRKDGSLGGYAWGIDAKKMILHYENASLMNKKTNK